MLAKRWQIKAIELYGRALFILREIVREVLLAVIVLIPIVLAFTAGALYAVTLRIIYAVREGFKDGQRFING
jgi:hypothetical protein